ncbi:hypothetical protein AGMMS50229_09570 [Campylobacterota bacterium]|nr:hypothetical protein AGMMS50229_09570 [Campylobacterota bacterium]
MNTVVLNTRIDRDEKKLFTQIAKSLGTTPATALKKLVRAFIDQGGFPFDDSHEYTYELKGEALESYNQLMDELARGTAKRYPNMQALYDEMGI